MTTKTVSGIFVSLTLVVYLFYSRYKNKTFIHLMASSYNTRSTTAAAGASSVAHVAQGGQSQQLQGTGMASTVDDVPQRHFCLVFTNNPRMLRKAQNALTATTTSTAVS